MTKRSKGFLKGWNRLSPRLIELKRKREISEISEAGGKTVLFESLPRLAYFAFSSGLKNHETRKH
jgi:hypothetical protein